MRRPRKGKELRSDVMWGHYLLMMADQPYSAPTALQQTMLRVGVRLTDDIAVIQDKVTLTKSILRQLKEGKIVSQSFDAELEGDPVVTGDVELNFAWNANKGLVTVTPRSARYSRLLVTNNIRPIAYDIIKREDPVGPHRVIALFRRVPPSVWALLAIAVLGTLLLLVLYGLK